MKTDNKIRTTRSRRPDTRQHTMPSENAGDPINPDSMRMENLIEEDFERLMHGEENQMEDPAGSRVAENHHVSDQVVSEENDDEENYYHSLGGHPVQQNKRKK